MVAFGLVLIFVGALAILAALFVNGGQGGEILGFAMSVEAIFLTGVAAGAAIIWGYSILKWGTKRGIAQRKERKELNRLSNRLEDRLDRDQGTDTKPAQGDTTV